MAIILGNPIMLGGGGGSQSELKKISTLTEGTIIKINENGVPQDYYLAQQNYQPSLNGSGRVLFVRKNLPDTATMWGKSASNQYAVSAVDEILNGTVKSWFDADVREAMGETTFPYTAGGTDDTVTSLRRAVFTLSLAELGLSFSYSGKVQVNAEGTKIPIADDIKIGYFDGAATTYWTRTPLKKSTWGSADAVAVVNASGEASYTSSYAAAATWSMKPCFTLPNTATVNPEPNVDGSYTLQLENVNLTLNSLMAGDTVRVKENGVFQDYYVAQQNYRPDLNGTGRTLFVRKDIHSLRAWDDATNAYATSDIDTWLNGEFKSMFDADVREAMGETDFLYSNYNASFAVASLRRSVFLLSLSELGLSAGNANTEGEAVSVADRLKIAYLNATATAQYTRTPLTSNTSWVFTVNESGAASAVGVPNEHGIRPCFTLPASFSIEQNSEGTYDLVYESDYPMGYLELTIEGGTTQPTNPNDNTIWVNTDVDLGLTYLAPNAPSNPQVGDVWVNTTNKYNSNGTNASTNLIRVNDNPYLEINVMNISQWDGSAWMARDGSAIYANGGWTAMALYLWHYGTQQDGYRVASTASNNTTSPGNSSLGSWSINGDALRLATNSSYKYGVIQFQPKINLAKYNKLKAIAQNSGGSSTSTYVCYGTGEVGNGGTYTTACNGGNTMVSMSVGQQATFELDISTVDGEFFVGMLHVPQSGAGYLDIYSYVLTA